MALQKIILLFLLIVAVSSEIKEPCYVLEKLKQVPNLIGYKSYTAEDYICLISYISSFDTTLHTSSSEYGILQINSLWWCDDGVTVGRKNLCGDLCDDFLDNDITNDLLCLKRIVKDSNGLEAWPVWKEKCKGKDLSHFTKNCK
ncbi:lysozyme C-like [Mantella aurantiaca]